MPRGRVPRQGGGYRLTRAAQRDAAALVAAIVRCVPSLPGAACVGRWELFDEVAGARGPERRELERQWLERAAALCRRCPARPACPESVAELRTGGQTGWLTRTRGHPAWGGVGNRWGRGTTPRYRQRPGILVATKRP